MKFYIVDVFAEAKYRGNPLAVIIPDRDISMEEMHHIAREINFSETSFIMSGKQENGGYDVRIFTPDVEIPFAGHPTLGTAYIINEMLESEPAKEIKLNLEVGQIPVTVEGNFFTMKQNQPSFGQIIPDYEWVAQVLSIDAEQISKEYPIQLVSTGLPAVIVPLDTLEAVKSCKIDHNAFQNFIDAGFQCSLLVYTKEAQEATPIPRITVRVFMDDTGFLEDPATGSANGNLAAYLLEHEVLESTDIQYEVHQGKQINRPSLLSVQGKKEGDYFHLLIGGKVFKVAEGVWE